MALPRLVPRALAAASGGRYASTSVSGHFFAAAREVGAERTDLPVWALKRGLRAQDAFGSLAGGHSDDVQYKPLPGLRGGFQVLGLLSAAECNRFIGILDALGFHEDAAVSLPYSFRHMSNCNLVVPKEVDEEVFRRCKHILPEVGGYKPLGLNAKFRCYRYGAGDYFKPHTDGSWPGSRIVDSEFVQDAFGDRVSQLTFLVLLSDDYDGGSTRFFDREHPGGVVAETRTPLGAALCFPHGFHPDSPLHEGSPVTRGVKYMIRTEVLYPIGAHQHAS